MAMERLPLIKDTHSRNVTALAYNPVKHELIAGFEGDDILHYLNCKNVSYFHVLNTTASVYLYSFLHCFVNYLGNTLFLFSCIFSSSFLA